MTSKLQIFCLALGIAGAIALSFPITTLVYRQTTKTRIRKLAEAQQKYYSAKHETARNLAELISSQPTKDLGLDDRFLRDCWGNKLRYLSKGGIISSAGQDGEFGTRDDLDIVSYNFCRDFSSISNSDVKKIEWLD